MRNLIEDGVLEGFQSTPAQEREPGQVVHSFQASYERRDFGAARAIFNQHSLTIWYGIQADVLGHILDDIVAEDPRAQDVTSGFRVFLASTREQRYFQPAVFNTMQETSDPAGLMMRFGYINDLRLRGYSVEALALYDVLRGDLAVIQPFGDRRNSWPQFLALQQGITAMVAGDFGRAKQHFAECLARSTTPGLEMLHRSALARSALIEASFGDPQIARMLLDRAEAVTRTTSWIEPSIDASANLTKILIEPNIQLAHRQLAALDISKIGEMWPFYVFAVYQIHDRAGAHSRIPSRLESLKALPFPRIPGEGFSGSVLPLALGCHKLYTGATREARELISAADSTHFISKLALALLEVWAGDPQVAVQLTWAVRSETLELRRTELWRVSIAAKAHITLGDEAAAVDALRELQHLVEPIRDREIYFFTADVAEVGRTHLDWWPEQPPPPDAYFERLPAREQHLTDRELEIVRLLAQGLSRPAITQELFVTLNTLKSQLRTIYRKLGASSKSEALQSAAKRGLL